MSECQVVRHGAPTLAGLKTGSMFSCPAASREEALREVGRFDRMLRAKGVRFVLLHFDKGRALIYLYRSAYLRRDLCDREARTLLRALSYPLWNAEECVEKLAARVADSAEFPHEVGLFLGYPPEDVRGFIQKGPRNCRSVGCWKVYGDRAAAERRFAQFRKCTAAYVGLHARGRTLERLTVSR
jgi:hypothetical protein